MLILLTITVFISCEWLCRKNTAFPGDWGDLQNTDFFIDRIWDWISFSCYFSSSYS